MEEGKHEPSGPNSNAAAAARSTLHIISEHQIAHRRRTLEIEDGDQLTTTQPITTSEPNGESDNSRPLLLVKFTGSRLLSITLVIVYGTMKLIPAFRKSELTWLDVLLGVSIGVIALYLGWLETVRPPLATWFFHDDLTSDLFFFPLGVFIFASVFGYPVFTWAFLVAYMISHIISPSTRVPYALLAVVLALILWTVGSVSGIYVAMRLVRAFPTVNNTLRAVYRGYMDRFQVHRKFLQSLESRLYAFTPF